MLKNPYDDIAYCLFYLSLIYSLYCVFQAFDFVKEASLYTGIFSLLFLNLSLFFSLWSCKWSKNYPKILGFCAFFWSILHFANYFVFTQNISFLRLTQSISTRTFEASGFIAFIIMTILFISSFKTFRKIEKIRKLSYLSLFLGSYHYFLSAKVPMFWQWSAIIVAIGYCTFGFLKHLFITKKMKNI
ncbi:sulfite oxidase heme-binding subunit YedZ [Campylobacter sp. MIT 21-1685]|uniref:ferric reductase-like transmembrane domain-containing protein n=1 Tax=unclassified Campylobacter TaxID=2593542 RepID=UPI00224B6B10|nr:MULTISPECIES: ferric reductase-like transmembrane domain-containing protein [unclassified Campylobacter]MCX2683257.1 sulfite oxidase heme-binding subunit YedZ [Campylobacter sp. MIT 21-1684]MCX2751550.1 sulfite oxidase heme-binding subunit YedZ [Campylobacter sp. MIT 21-1682]MCX2807749.1 sulfite oxidase heme-binding subunit YedZ [Campylobacter sp. MIT 21-1685]